MFIENILGARKLF